MEEGTSQLRHFREMVLELAAKIVPDSSFYCHCSKYAILREGEGEGRWRERARERERERGREGGREAGRQGGMEAGRQGGREAGRFFLFRSGGISGMNS